MFSNNALFHGLAVFIDTYSNDDATDVSGGSGFTRRHAVFLHFELACWQDVFSMPTEFILTYLHIFVSTTKADSNTQACCLLNVLKEVVFI